MKNNCWGIFKIQIKGPRYNLIMVGDKNRKSIRDISKLLPKKIFEINFYKHSTPKCGSLIIYLVV